MPPAQPACPGFQFAGVIAGIKASGRPDLGLILADDDVPTAAVFTQNRVRAAPVLLSEANVKSGMARAIIVNSGNANACTGDKGDFDAAAMAEYAARAIGCDKKRVLVASTGIIGQPLPIERIVAATPRLRAGARGDGLDDFARAIMTTDRFEKRALHLVPLGPKTRARVIGVAKGAGMIAPNMATTLAFLCTDAAVSKGFLRTMLREEIASTFNAVSVDGDTSTNDMVAIMASGAAKNKPIDSDAAGGGKGKALRQAVHDVLDELSRQIVRDGEGATHVVTIEVAGAENAAAAAAVARRIAQSPLCKTAFFGADPNWGRIVAAIGNAGVDVDPRKLDVAIGEVEICRGGLGIGAEAERHAHEVMRRGEYTIRVHLNRGRAQGRHTTCDLTVDYVKLNADYHT
jgi:glutamate N-acetyltransferase/amino-acid N-acetyltransferase